MIARAMDGAHVLLPRSPAKAHAFADKLREFGAEPFVFPVTQIVAHSASLPEAGVLPGRYDWVVFTSQNGVEQTLAAMARTGLDPAVAFAGVSIACVGAATRRMLEKGGLCADLVPHKQDGRSLAKAILEASGSELRVLVPRAENGRPELAADLRAAGVTVTEWVVYRSESVSRQDLQPLLDMLDAGQLNVAVFFAPSQVDALCTALADRATQTLNRLFLAAIGDTTAEHMRALSLRVDLVASSPDVQTLASVLATRYASHKQGASDAVP